MKKFYIIFMMFLSNPSFSNVEITEEEKQYELFMSLNSVNMTEEEADNTRGSAGPLITGGVGFIAGGASSIAGDISADRDIDWSSAGINGVAGFVAGATGVGLAAGGGRALKAMSSLGGSALGISSAGAMNAARRSMSGGGGGGGCTQCHMPN